MQPLEAHRAMPEERPPGTGPEPPLGELPGDDQRLAAEEEDLAEHAGAKTRSRARKEEMEKSAAALNIKDGNAPAPSIHDQEGREPKREGRARVSGGGAGDCARAHSSVGGAVAIGS